MRTSHSRHGICRQGLAGIIIANRDTGTAKWESHENPSLRHHVYLTIEHQGRMHLEDQKIATTYLSLDVCFVVRHFRYLPGVDFHFANPEYRDSIAASVMGLT